MTIRTSIYQVDLPETASTINSMKVNCCLDSWQVLTLKLLLTLS